MLLVRARRLVDVGLALEDIAGVLASERRLDLDELLAEVATDLDRRERELQVQRRRIIALRSRLSGPAPLADALNPAGLVELSTRSAGQAHPAPLRRRTVSSCLYWHAMQQCECRTFWPNWYLTRRPLLF